MHICVIKGELKIGSNQKGETFVWWSDGNKWLSMEEFKKCEIEDGTRFVLYIKDDIKHKVDQKNEYSHSFPTNHSTFNSGINYSISPTPLKIDNIKLIQNEIRQPESKPITPIPPDTTSVSDLFIGGAASIALLMSVVQQVRQKKKEAESNLCCNNNKIEISKFDAKIQKLETEIKTKTEKDNKGVFAEILEARKEIRDIKEEFEHGKEDIQKIIEIMTLNNKSKD